MTEGNTNVQFLTRKGFQRRLDTKLLSNTEVYTILYGIMASTTINRWKLLGGYLSSMGRDLQLDMSESRADSLVRLGLQASSDYLPTRTNFIDWLLHWVCWMMEKCLLVYISQSVLRRMLELWDSLWQKKENLIVFRRVFSMSCRNSALHVVYWEKLLFCKTVGVITVKIPRYVFSFSGHSNDIHFPQFHFFLSRVLRLSIQKVEVWKKMAWTLWDIIF